MALLLASNNTGKLREVRLLLADLGVASPADLGIDLDVEETGQTFAANAELKARAFAAASGYIALADDSGLEVDALNGAPGVRSARYGAPDLDDEGRYLHLLSELQSYPEPSQRIARFRCAISAISPDGRQCRAEGTCEGQIAQSPAGSNGFGYDPVFLVPDHNATMAQLDAAIKNSLSHRAQALAAIIPLLKSTFPELNISP
ncbi:MAG TPA: RdgB/HAM1 family non-canonical purine NTP pyrophosphatase [Candidatus Latescibacteria bacterium]|nr:RdgB/HAM1 family non-canonical purine NTP pyrophosphatase [Candidatus Handelsmanbacteria bacterium]HIL11021.1 RdgB/HAM1 family non-canonical purine NTP pyrophosphatase [Candidatus Latescibacterota bacterium]